MSFVPPLRSQRRPSPRLPDRAVPFDADEMQRMIIGLQAEQKFRQLTHAPAQAARKCRFCKNPMVGVGDVVLTNGNTVVRFKTVQFEVNGASDIKFVDAQILTETTCIRCPQCDKEQFIHIDR